MPNDQDRWKVAAEPKEAAVGIYEPTRSKTRGSGRVSYDYRASSDEYVPIGPVCRNKLHMQAQYGSRYLKDPRLGKGIRWRGGHEGQTYHDIEIHKDDVEEFVTRVNNHRRENGEIR